ncbi:MAG: prepilin-type N-terminal cleavage/methylation domain-containing protein [Clostridia bacterium]|jgi:prepilin-type N-terminal cleavage/methylation domain-containing protein|nr:prepilin-type N-terminal cleavage/methylation domain-containing protein [Clostridia bacterium]
MFIKDEKGLTLIELMISLTIMSMILVSLNQLIRVQYQTSKFLTDTTSKVGILSNFTSVADKDFEFIDKITVVDQISSTTTGDKEEILASKFSVEKKVEDNLAPRPMEAYETWGDAKNWWLHASTADTTEKLYTTLPNTQNGRAVKAESTRLYVRTPVLKKELNDGGIYKITIYAKRIEGETSGTNFSVYDADSAASRSLNVTKNVTKDEWEEFVIEWTSEATAEYVCVNASNIWLWGGNIYEKKNISYEIQGASIIREEDGTTETLVDELENIEFLVTRISTSGEFLKINADIKGTGAKINYIAQMKANMWKYRYEYPDDV